MMLRTLEEKVDPRHAALIIVDVQNDFCSSEGAREKEGKSRAHVQAMMPNLHRLLAHARQVQMPVFHVVLEATPHVQAEAWLEQRQRTGHALVCADEWGAALYELEAQPGEIVVTKHRYSGFVGTNLELILRSKGIKSVLMAGVATSVCVESTGRDAFMRDFYVVLVEDCCGSVDARTHANAVEHFDHYFGIVVKADDVIAAWQRLREPAQVAAS
ncbi:MAG: cysteine hydrolase [Chloroflexi bacterium]|nr:cysteine hydrolase [Chloroflexota bacterium]